MDLKSNRNVMQQNREWKFIAFGERRKGLIKLGKSLEPADGKGKGAVG